MSYTKKDIKVTPIPEDWPGIIAYLRTRPTMLIYKESVYCLAAFISGLHHSTVSGSSETCGVNLEKFEGWVAQTYNPRGLTHNSFMLTLQFAIDEKEAFWLWFKWYDEFCHLHKFDS